MSRSKEVPQPDEIDLYIFDMDGTTYLLDGEGNKYKGSTLENTVLRNIFQFVIKKENIGENEAKTIVEMAKASGLTYSVFFSQRYSITRSDYFYETWNIDPIDIVSEYESAVLALKNLSEMGKKIVLVTSAPSVWAKRVCQYLGIEDIFSQVFTGDSFGNKSEVFKQLLSETKPSRMLSVGDQFETDIGPALEMGMQVLHVTHPNETSLLLGKRE